jgi:hypothetical protein
MSGGIIATISLLVGGMAIMNIMPREHQRNGSAEIGICKAVGCHPGLGHFSPKCLSKSVVIALLGAANGGGGIHTALVQILESISPVSNAPVITAGAMPGCRFVSVPPWFFAGLFSCAQSCPPGSDPGASL